MKITITMLPLYSTKTLILSLIGLQILSSKLLLNSAVTYYIVDMLALNTSQDNLSYISLPARGKKKNEYRKQAPDMPPYLHICYQNSTTQCARPMCYFSCPSLLLPHYHTRTGNYRSNFLLANKGRCQSREIFILVRKPQSMGQLKDVCLFSLREQR